MKANERFDKLVQCLSKLPGIGRRSAERIAVKLVVRRTTLFKELMAILSEGYESLCCCSRCGGITDSASDPCGLCADSTRDGHMLCVVEEPGDIGLIEKTGIYRGHYHALMGKLSPMNGEGIQDIRLATLIKRIRDEAVQEVILALNSDVESDATAAYIRDRLAGEAVRISRLAFGMPVGSGVAYTDSVTLGRAIKGRQNL